MWENVTQEMKYCDYDWLRDGMVNGTLIWCTDGSYKRKIAPDVCGVGWEVECKAIAKRLEGLFDEITNDANSYQVEQLGLNAIHHILCALLTFFVVEKWGTNTGCDNEGAIKISRRSLKRIRPSMSCADILTNIRSARNKMTTYPNYFHVYSHMNNYLNDEQLSFE